MPAEPFNPVVVAPTYDNARTLPDIVRGVAALGLPLIVVNDGSTDATATLLADADAASRRGGGGSGDGFTVLTHPRNRGKAAALRTGFAHAAAAGYTHAVTIDTDGQHDPAEIPRLLERARREPAALVLGLRDQSAPGYPSKSRLGRRMSNLFIRMESGVRVEDSQCGLRVYPLGLVGAVRCGAGRFGFETEIVTRAAWAGCPVVEVPVACRYLPPGERVSHLNPFLDTVRGFGMHIRLLARALLPWPRHPQWPLPEARARVASAGGPRRGPWRRFIAWINPAEAWRQARGDQVSREAFAAGLALGAFVGNLPAYGFHAFIGLYMSKRFHMNPVAVFLGTNISTPPVGPLLNVAAVAVGSLLIHGSLPSPADFDLRTLGWLTVIANLRNMLLEWLLGSIIVGLACAGIVFMVGHRVLRLAAAGSDDTRITRGSASPGDAPPGRASSGADTPPAPAARPAGPASGPAA